MCQTIDEYAEKYAKNYAKAYGQECEARGEARAAKKYEAQLADLKAEIAKLKAMLA